MQFLRKNYQHCHSRENGNPVFSFVVLVTSWIPAFAGMTPKRAFLPKKPIWRHTHKSPFILILILAVLAPASTSAFYFGSEKSLGLAGAYSAIADDTGAIFMNPAGLSQNRTYLLDINHQRENANDSKLWGISIVDSETSSMAAGFAYYKMSRADSLLSDREELFALALSEQYSTNLAIGLTYKYIKQRERARDDDNCDLGILYRLAPQLNFALVGKNLFNSKFNEVHRMYTSGLAYKTLGGFGFSCDITKDVDTKTANDITYSYGVEALTLGDLKLRAGYLVDKIKDKKFYSFNTVYNLGGFSLGYAFMRDEVDSSDSIHHFTLSFVL